MSLGERLRVLRDKQGLSQLAASRKIGISNKVLSNYENGVTSPDLETLVLLCSYYKVSSDYLLGLNSPKVENNVLPTEEEQKILTYYNRLNDDYKDSAKGYMVDLYREQQKIHSDKVKKI